LPQSSRPLRTRRARFLLSGADAAADCNPRALRYMPDAVISAPNENTHAANANTLLSGFGPIAAGTRQSPINIPKAPTAIIQLPVREDMYVSFARRDRATPCNQPRT